MKSPNAGPDRQGYITACWLHAKQNWLVATVMWLYASYKIVSSAQTFTSFPKIRLPVIPLPWFLVILLLAVLIVLVEGGYRLRQADYAKFEATLDDRRQALIERCVQGVLTYAKNRKAERKDVDRLMFSKFWFLSGHPKPANDGHLKTGQRRHPPGH